MYLLCVVGLQWHAVPCVCILGVESSGSTTYFRVLEEELFHLSLFVCVFFFLSSLLWMKNAVAVVSRAMDVTRTDIANLVKQRNSRLRSPYLVLLFFTFCPRFVFKDCFDYNAHNELRQSGVSSIAAVIGALLLCRGYKETKR